MRRVPVRHGQEDALRVARLRQRPARQLPVARPGPLAGGVHVARPVAHVEVEARVEQGACTRRKTPSKNMKIKLTEMFL